MPERYEEYLRHILDECAYITSAIKPTDTFKAFIDNEDKKRAVVRSLEIIGEATREFPLT